LITAGESYDEEEYYALLLIAKPRMNTSMVNRMTTTKQSGIHLEDRSAKKSPALFITILYFLA
jgi:hypothetical protein